MPAIRTGDSGEAQRILRKRILVYPFGNQTSYGRGRLSEEIQNEIFQILEKNEKFSLISSTEVQKTLESKRLKGVSLIANGELNKPVARKMWQWLGIHGVIYGEVLRLDVKNVWNKKEKRKNTVLFLKILFRVDSGLEGSVFLNKIVQSNYPWIEGAEISYPEIQSLIGKTIASQEIDLLQALSRIPWSGEILRISQDMILINGGQWSGLKPGDSLRVLSKQTNKIANSSTLGKIRLEKALGRDNSACKLVEGGPFQVGDIVLY
jgi:hypothetical protein